MFANNWRRHTHHLSDSWWLYDVNTACWLLCQERRTTGTHRLWTKCGSNTAIQTPCQARSQRVEQKYSRRVWYVCTFFWVHLYCWRAKTPYLSRDWPMSTGSYDTVRRISIYRGEPRGQELLVSSPTPKTLDQNKSLLNTTTFYFFYLCWFYNNVKTITL
jgi:hypothetical protein